MHSDSEELPPYQQINRLFEQRRDQPDDAILAELRAMPVLPDEELLMEEDHQRHWHQIYLFVALADQAAERRLRPAIPLLLERASYGDPGETMRGLCHALEAIVNPEWEVLADACMQAASYPQRGARLWAISELGRLRDQRARGVLAEALNDPAEEVRSEARFSLEMLDQARS